MTGPGGERPAHPKIPVAIVTGFLGSGKTTHLNRALRDPRMSGALVVVNEFGEVGLDHALMESSDDQVVVLENGCLCCTVFGDLIGTLYDLYHRRLAGEIALFDRVVIETSGLADPSSVVQAFLSDPTLEGLYRLSCMLTTVDAVNFVDTLRNYDAAVRQIALADHIVLTKLDLIDEPSRSAREAEVRGVVRTINGTARIVRVGAAPFSISAVLSFDDHAPLADAAQADRWLGRVAEGGDHGHDHRSNEHAADHLKIVTMSYERASPLPRRALELLLAGIEHNLGSSLLRLKAIVTVAGEERGPAVLQGAQHLLHNLAWLEHWPFADRKSRFVFIVAGLDGATLREMVALLDRIATRSASALAA